MPIQALLALYWSEHMDGLSLDLAIFLIATFAGALVAGLSGFAFGLVAASIWLYILVSAYRAKCAMEATERFGRWPPAKARGDVARYPSGNNRG